MSVYRYGFKYYRKFIPLTLLCMVMGFAAIYIGLLFPQLTQIILDNVILGESAATEGNFYNFLLLKDLSRWELLAGLVVTFLILQLLRHVLLYSRNNLFQWYGLKIENQLRKDSYHKLLSQSTIMLSRYNTGDLLSILNNDCSLFKEAYSSMGILLADCFFYIGMCTFFLIRIHWMLAILPFAVMPVIIIVLYRFIKRARRISSHIRDCSADLSMVVQENINGVRIVRSFANEAFEIKKFNKRNDAFMQAYFSHANLSSKYNALILAIRHVNYVGSLLVGGLLALSGHISVGSFVAFVSYTGTLMDVVTGFVNYLFLLQQYLESGSRLLTFLETGNLIDNPLDAKHIAEKPSLRLERFGINMDGQQVLKNIDLDVPYGKKVGIMGGTGSGKTVLLKSLARLYDGTSGGMTINGADIRSLDLFEVRRQFAYVFQDVFLFSNTIDSNIAYYDDKRPFSDVVACAKDAEADGFIQKLPEGYDTIVGERGVGLSGGQKQRISIARALLKNANVLVLDAATSALDNETEKTLLENLKKYGDKTMFISAHRVSSVKDCDEILYMQDGEILERGTHEELLAQNGRYAEIYRRQTLDRGVD